MKCFSRRLTNVLLAKLGQEEGTDITNNSQKGDKREREEERVEANNLIKFRKDEILMVGSH